MFWSELSLLLIILISTLNADTRVCQSKNVRHEYFLGSKTAYRYRANLNDTEMHVPGCLPLKIWMVVRHGTRYPGEKITLKMNERLPIMQEQIFQNASKGTLCELEIEALKIWKPSAQPADGKNLAHEGEDEMIELAERMQLRFPTLFIPEYSNASFLFKHTATQRCAESARHFTMGLFGRKMSRYVWYPEPVYKDPILRFYKLCDKWKTTVKENPDTYKERQLFEKTSQVKKMQEAMSKRLGLNYLLSVETIQLMYTTCAFETAWNFRQISPWCAIFSDDSLRVLEYLEDLKFYWVDGYGFEITSKQACAAINDMFEYFENIDDTLKATVYFSHSGTILKLLTHLGLYKEPNGLRHDNYHPNYQRRWRVSEIDCFASNIAFVLYNCEGELKVLTLHQEQPVIIPGCPENDLCPLSTMKDIFKDSINNCNFAEMCALNRTYTENVNVFDVLK